MIFLFLAVDAALKAKYELVKSKGVRGLGMWTADSGGSVKARAQPMWDAIPAPKSNIVLKTDDAAVPPLFLDVRDLGVRPDDGLDEYDDTKALAAVTSSPSLLSPPPKPLLCPCADQALCKSLSPQPPNHAGRDEVFAFSSWSFNGEQARSGWTAPQNLDWSKITAFAPFDDLSATSYGGGFSRGR